MVKNFSLNGVRLFILAVGFTLLYQPFQAQQLTRFKPDTQSLMIDLTEISSSSVRYEVYDFLQSNNDIEILPFESASKVIVTSTVLSQSELQQYYEDAVRRISSKNNDFSKDMHSKIIVDFASKYGFETTDHLMRSVTETENDSCHNSLPFCTDLVYNFPAGVNSGYAEIGPNYHCLQTSPNPAWYHMKIAIAGSLTIKIFSTPVKDIDFCLWGPFDDPTSICATGLPLGKVIDCSYAPGTAPEYCNIPNGILGKYYILLLCNFSNDPCNITFQKTSGSGATDCTIVPPPIGSNSPVCFGEDILLTADDFAGATYEWSGPNGWSSNQQNPIIHNADISDSGEYSLVITVGGSESDPVNTNVVVNALPVPQFTADDVCFGTVTEFVNQSTTNPDGQAITSRLWNFGDMQTSTLENPTHTYAQPGEYTVSLTCYTGMFNCQQSVTHTVNVYEFPIVNAGIDQSIPNGWSTALIGEISGGTGDLQYEWSHPELLVNPNVLNPTTLNLSQSVVFTLTVTDQVSGCVESDDVSVNVTGGALSVITSADPAILCEGETSQLLATPNGGAPQPTYTWSSVPVGFSSDIPNPVVTPNTTTTYTVSVFDGQVTVTNSTTVTVKPVPVANAGLDERIFPGTFTTLNGSSSGGSGTFTYLWSPADSLANPLSGKFEPNPITRLLNDTVNPTIFTLLINDNNGCISEPDQVVINVKGNYLSVSITPLNEDYDLCFGDSTILSAQGFGGSESYTYNWTTNNSSWTSTLKEPWIKPGVNTTYTVRAFDTFKYVFSSVEIIVNPLPVVELKPANINWFGTDTINVCKFDSIWLDAGPNMDYLWDNGSINQRQKAATNGLWPEFRTYSVVVTNPVTGCENSDIITVYFDGKACGLGLDERTDISSILKISPNPTNGTFRLSLADIPEDGILFLMDAGGKVVSQLQVCVTEKYSGNADFDITKLKDGSYLMYYHSTNYRAVKQIIKN